MAYPRVLGMVMAGGRGSRLYPLTRNQVKPAVPFGGKYRVIDFVLSNFVNSGVFSLYVLIQYQSLSLIEHLRTGWRTRGMIKDHFVTVVPPQWSGATDLYRGTAHAIAQNVNLIRHYAPDVVAVFGADHVFRMDVRQMVDFHQANQADVTIAAVPVERSEAERFGVVECDLDGRVTRLVEKPDDPTPIPSEPEKVFASMGNYLFDPEYLIDLAEGVLVNSSRKVDLSGDLLPGEEKRARMFAYDFQRNTLPGAAPDQMSSYWRDIGTIPSYYQAHMDMLSDPPRLNLDNPRWQIRGARFNSPPTRIDRAELDRVIVCEGSNIGRAKLRNVLVGRGVRIEDGAEISDSVLMDAVHIARGARVERAIIDRNIAVGAAETLAPDIIESNLELHFDKASGIVVVPRPESSGHDFYPEALEEISDY